MTLGIGTRLSRGGAVAVLVMATLATAGLAETSWAGNSDSAAPTTNVTAATATGGSISAPAMTSTSPTEFGGTCSSASPCTVLHTSDGYLLDEGAPSLRWDPVPTD